MKLYRTIATVCLFSWFLPAHSTEFSGMILLQDVSRDSSNSATESRQHLETQILFNCKQSGPELQCSETQMSVYRENPRALAAWRLVTADGKLTEEGRAAYQNLLRNECAAVNDMELGQGVPNPAYAEIVKELNRDLERVRAACASEQAAARAWMEQIERKKATCLITGWGPYERVFKQVGEGKWVRSAGNEDLMTLTSGPLLMDGTGQGWTYVAEGRQDLEGKPWKYTYVGKQILYQIGFELSSLKDCDRILVD